MKIRLLSLLLAPILLWLNESASAAQITLTAGAGYRQLVMDIAQTCKRQDNLDIQTSFGNFGQMKAQIQTTGQIQAVISAKSFFTGHHIAVANYDPLGRGTLVLAWRKGLSLSQPKDILQPAIKRIAIPHLKKALYGRAGWQYLQSVHMESVKNKLYMVSTVPQVTSYLVTGEVDAGFSNQTDIQKVKDKIGGYIPLTSGYRPIEIVSAILQGQPQTEAIRLYRHCIQSDAVKAIVKKHGL
ncbi:molybdate ABC transporter substrate-binding protein [Celerinatantimonas sp. YJH-8]|uniref:molybdate ABC transporter substrate-binding protein n=1 Tax=Celerinatantimonas sp. YJH-8 TaxID=3228714 RepID=UPI0038CA0D92